jgi:hypothetical protein
MARCAEAITQDSRPQLSRAVADLILRTRTEGMHDGAAQERWVVDALRSDPTAFAIVSQRIGSSSTLLWTGRPQPGIIFRPIDVSLIPGTVLFLIVSIGIASIWYIAPGIAPLPFRLIVPIAVAVGVYIAILRFPVDAWCRSHTFYGLTKVDAIIVYDYVPRDVRTINLVSAPEIGLTEWRSGRGIIRFGPLPDVGTRRNMPVGPRSGPPAFENIDDVAAVYQIVRQLSGDTLVPESTIQ